MKLFEYALVYSGQKIIEEEIGRMISKMHVVMTRSVSDNLIELRYVVSFRKDA